MAIYILIDVSQGYCSTDLNYELDYMLIGAFKTYKEAFEEFMNKKLEEIENVNKEEERDRDLDNFLIELDKIKYETIEKNYDTDDILEKYNWKVMELGI